MIARERISAMRQNLRDLSSIVKRDHDHFLFWKDTHFLHPSSTGNPSNVQRRLMVSPKEKTPTLKDTLLAASYLPNDGWVLGMLCLHLQGSYEWGHYEFPWASLWPQFTSRCANPLQVMDNALPNMSSAGGQQQVWRAQFSSLAPVDLKRAMANLGSPNKDMSDSADARADAWQK